ncbi:hypothetical protein GCM10022225_09430 [Plantactinospora mayteni]|uniref:Uncharacterized protein n=1 Tax=Plantactinospora mayteni TaxID=566021 RepID=A0ABQ4EI63_9ACTN|nr:hypothetical protein Pma05_08830 [Plantactinospora mayteni]
MGEVGSATGVTPTFVAEPAGADVVAGTARAGRAGVCGHGNLESGLPRPSRDSRTTS